MNAEVCRPRCSCSETASVPASQKLGRFTPHLSAVGAGRCQKRKVLNPIILLPRISCTRLREITHETITPILR